MLPIPNDAADLYCARHSPRGHRCPEGTSEPIPCAAGEFQLAAGAGECQRCEPGHDSSNGSARCSFCAHDYYRPTATSPVKNCKPCSTIRNYRGVACGPDTVVANLALRPTYWRHSNETSH
eukprot:4043648-Prymnesium_polylepis.1